MANSLDQRLAGSPFSLFLSVIIILKMGTDLLRDQGCGVVGQRLGAKSGCSSHPGVTILAGEFRHANVNVDGGQWSMPG